MESTREMVRDWNAEDFSETKNKRPRVTWFATWSTLFVAFTGLWQYGFAIGSINAAYIPLMGAIRRLYEERNNATASPELVNAVWVTISAAFPVGGIFGSLLVGPIVRNFGRLKGLLLGHVITVFMSLLCALTTVLRSPEVMILGRIGMGISSAAIGTGVAVMYIVEVSPRHLRGVFGSMVSAGIALGLIASNSLGLPQALGNEKLWPVLLALTGLPSVLFIVLWWTISDSPRELFIENHKEQKAQKTLQLLRGVSDVSGELRQMRAELKQSTTNRQLTVLQVVRSENLRRPLTAAAVLAAALQLTGLNAMGFNMNRIFLAAGVYHGAVHYISIGLSSMVMLIHLTTARFIDKFGRKVLICTGNAIEGFSLFLLTISTETQHLSHAMAYVAVVASVGFWVGFGIGPGPVTTTLFSEVFDQSSRPAAITITNVVLWMSFATTVIITPYMLSAMAGYTFLPFGLNAFAASTFIWFYIPETKNKPFADIMQSFNSKKNIESEGMMEVSL